MTLDVSVICCQCVAQGSFSLLSLQILWLYLVQLSKWPSKNILLHLYKRCASHSSEGPNNYKHTFLKLKAIDMNQTPDWVIVEYLKYLLNDKGGVKNMEDSLNIKKWTILCLQTPMITNTSVQNRNFQAKLNQKSV